MLAVVLFTWIELAIHCVHIHGGGIEGGEDD